MRIPGSPGALGAAAADLDAAAGALGRDRGDLDRRASALTAPGQWEGEGAAAFRGSVAELDPQVDTLVGACRQASGALSAYAGALAAAQADADRLDAAAAAQHFVVDDQGGVRYTGPPVIEDPTQPQHSLAAAQQRLELEAQRILGEAETAAETARGRIDAARMSLVGPFRWSRPWENPWSSLGYAYTAYTSAATTYSLTRTELERLEGPRDAILRKIETASSPKKLRHWEKLLARYDREVSSELRGNLRGAMESADTWSARLRLSKGLAYSLGDLGEEAGPLSRAFAVRGVRAIPLIGIGLTAWQAKENIEGGAEPTEEVTADAASLAAGAVAADLAVGAAVALGLTAGAPIVAGLVVGGLVAYGVGEGVHWFFHTQVGHDVAQTVDHAVGDAVHAVGDAGHAVGSAVSKGWHSIFG
jgi:uncharacterized protein YukE